MTKVKRILIVDDEEINLDFFELMLGKLGYETLTAKNGDQGLEAVRKFKPDLILLDNMMPRKTGWEVTRIVRSDPEWAEYSETPIIMFSALDDVRDKVEGLELGADDYITKPFNFTEVLARIRAVLKNRDLINQIERRERRLAVVEKIGERLSHLIDSFRKPLDSVLAIGPEGVAGEAGRQLERARDEAKAVLARLDVIRAEVSSLEREAAELKRSEIELRSIREELRDDMASQGERA